MNRNALVACVALVLALVLAGAPAVAAPAVVAGADAEVLPNDAELADFARSALAQAYPSDAPGAAALVVRQGRVVLRQGFGLSNLDLQVPVDPSHVFEIGSITKQFTCAAILRLAEEGKLELDEPITKLLTDLPPAYEPITLTHLMTHTAGVPSYTDFPEWMKRWREDMTLTTLIGLFRDKPLDFVPGQSWKYSNSGYILLGAAIEKASGKSYEDYVEQEIFAPLGMKDTRYGHPEDVVAGRAAGYAKGAEGWANAPYLSLTQPYAAGSLMSNVDDLAKWSDALETGKVVSAGSQARMFTAAVLEGGENGGVSTRYGMGYGLPVIAGHPAHAHGGGIHGYRSDLLRVPDVDLLVVVLSNNTTVNPGDLSRKIAEHALGGPLPAPPAVVLEATALEAFVGTYGAATPVAGAVQRRTVTRDGDQLWLQRLGAPRVALRPIGDDRFVTEEGNVPVRFLRDGAGKVIAVEVDNGSGPLIPSPRVAATAAN